jgi:hypothetical protein
LAVSLAQVVLRDAWLTVVDGYRTGRQLDLTRAVTVLGRSDMSPLPFLGPTNKDLDQQHLRIIRCADGSFALEDNDSKLGTRLNTQPVRGRMPLKNGDVIRLGANLVRFNERKRRAHEYAPMEDGRPTLLSTEMPQAPPPPPVPTVSQAPPPLPPPAPGSPVARPWRTTSALPRPAPRQPPVSQSPLPGGAIPPPPPPPPRGP